MLWAATGLITAVFPIMSDDRPLGLGTSMYVYAAVNLVLLLPPKRLAPETEGRSLEQSELGLRD